MGVLDFEPLFRARSTCRWGSFAPGQFRADGSGLFIRTERALSRKTMVETTLEAMISRKSAELPCHPSAKTLSLVSRLWQAVAGAGSPDDSPALKFFFELGEVVAGGHTRKAGPEHPKKHTRRQ